MGYLVIMFNDGIYTLRCEIEEILTECGDFVGVESNPLV